jgi:modulator of FtsH protease HflK
MVKPVTSINSAAAKGNPRFTGLAFAVVIIFMGLISSFYMVDQKEKAVVLFLGKYNRTTEPGLHFKLPFGIERNYNVPTQRILKEEFGFRTVESGVQAVYSNQNFADESVMLTGDLNIVDVEWIIQYQISDPKQWLFNVENQNKTIRDISNSVINELVGDRTIFDVLSGERATIELKGQEMMNTYFEKYKLGAKVTTVKLQNIVPPKGQVQDSFEDVNKAIQDRSRLINEGKEFYNKSIPRARGEAQQVIQEAEGYASEKINIAKGDVARFSAVLQEYEKNPAITRMRLYYEMFDEVFKDSTNTELIDKNLKNFIPFKSLSDATRGGAK